MSSLPTSHAPSRVLFGAAYYAEYQQTDRLEQDLDLMAAAGFTVIRVGESVWSTWEPRDGEFDLEWLLPVLDGAHARGISVVLGTPTYAVPPWLQQAHPEIAAERSTGERIPWGARQEVDYTHPAFLFHAERVVRAVLRRYATHPAVIGFQVDNEPGLELFHNQGVFSRFVRRLKAEFGDVETLNREWGLAYWSHRLDDWSELWRPEGNSFPQYDLAWRRFQAELTTEFIGWQAALVGEYKAPGQFVTTCLQYPRRGLDDEQLFAGLDIAAGNPYYGMQDQLAIGQEHEPLDYWVTSGVPGLFRQADRMWASKQARYLITETNAQGIGAADTTFPPYPGQLKQAAYAFVSRGAAMIEYWQWNTLPYGAETYWGGILPHSLQPGRVYREIAEIGAELQAVGTTLDGYEPDADVAVLWSNPSRFALQFMPPFRTDGVADDAAYEKIVDAFHRGVVDSGRQARLLHTGQALALGAQALVDRFPVLVAAGVYVATDDELDLLAEYARLGGHLVLGPRTGYADEQARARAAVSPARLAAAAGVHYAEFSNLLAAVPVHAVGPDLQATGHARDWVDGLVLDGATPLASYDHPHFGTFPAVTTHAHGRGRVTVVGCLPSPDLAAAVLAWAQPAPVAAALGAAGSPQVTVSSGRLPDGRRAWFVFNWGWAPTDLVLSSSVQDLTTGSLHTSGSAIALDAWSTHALVDQ
ncbi:beta-galactosidase [Modestobacter sp. Leaf380]|uniref:beta-galactosidase n=1 Tax=Modestobacter sp. Leaf380 TaxID=1736356 RepID=UPI0006F61985|nr:beta-galactosidase [Modestobacter sp. Leaf380]KQS72118.1 beta-galactosidase [Modestobacter sp. Leaf380]